MSFLETRGSDREERKKDVRMCIVCVCVCVCEREREIEREVS